MKTTIFYAFVIAIAVCGCNDPSTKKISPASLVSNKVSVEDLYSDIYDGKDICDPEALAYKLDGSIGLPKSQDIEGAFINDTIIDNRVMIDFLQHEADMFSWKTFIAINWPSIGEQPDSTKCFGDTGPAVWESWMPSHRIFKRNGEAPDSWPFKKNTEDRNLRILGKLSHTMDQISNLEVLNAENAPVIDHNGNYVLYEIFYNKSAYDYVVKGKLYNKQGQREFIENWPSNTTGIAGYRTDSLGNKIVINIEKEQKTPYFPVGNIKDSTRVIGDVTYTFTKGTGAMILKTAWKVMLPSEDHSKYYTRKIKAGNSEITVGLVGMHIAHKIAEVTQWVWSTFEHTYNNPEMVDGDATFKKPKYVFFDGSKGGFETYNKPPEKLYQKKSERTPTQVVRMLQSIPTTQAVDQFFNDKIKDSNANSPWVNYSLVGTQWPYNPKLFSQGSMYQPQLLGNAIMETYQQSESSCMGCHKQARILRNKEGIGHPSDFIYGLSSAKE